MEYKYECNICFNDSICENSIVYMDCLHYMCFNCFRNLLTPKCPFCRSDIDLSKYDSIGMRINQIQVVNESLDDIFMFEAEYDSNFVNEQYDDFVVPTIRKDRHELKRNRILKKKEKLERLVNSTCSFSNFPNIKNRSIRKMLNKLNARLSSSY